jgi:hypothetical protein
MAQTCGPGASIQRDTETGCSRQPGFRCEVFSETELPVLSILGNPGGKKRAGADTPRLFLLSVLLSRVSANRR